MYIRGLIPWNFAILAEAVPLAPSSSPPMVNGRDNNFSTLKALLKALGATLEPVRHFMTQISVAILNIDML